MAAGTLDIVIEQGATFKRVLKLTDNATPTPNPIDLTGCTVRAQVRDKTSATTASATFTCTVTDAVGGEITIVLTPTNTSAIASASQERAGVKTNRDYVWDLEIVYPDTTVIRLLQGKATLSPEATK